ncbi:hypothetical protein IE53DRAFT_367768 [Violaceomyces palustris]|uniref:Uncharacterized protein n=1 Tax=Violaceomyces palustris TaxID=1673888 RepID=A0ACD0P168_9BASI|nr:hypothetical protein IE53DRAFT_367768 [Violaceomyces palustris]
MRIHLNLKPGSSSGSSSRGLTDFPPPSSHPSFQALPDGFLQMTPDGELILIELQGSLEFEYSADRPGQVLAKLIFEDGREDRPVLLVSHHRLEGRFIKLVKPLAVLEKRKRTEECDIAGRASDHEVSPGPEGEECSPRWGSARPVNDQGTEASRSELEEGDMDGARHLMQESRAAALPLSPTHNRKRAFDMAESSVDGPHLKSKKLEKGMAREHPSAKDQPKLISSRPVRPTPDHRDSHEFSSSPTCCEKEGDLATNGDQDRGRDGSDFDSFEEERLTATHYDVVSIIRRKILFSKRPEPIVRLEGATILSDST